MESSNQMAVPTSMPRGATYDRVVVIDASGQVRQLTRSEFERLPLRERVTYLIGGTAQFFAGLVQVSAADAMKG
jgi:hypothetical protein